jgi:hypothetical protein
MQLRRIAERRLHAQRRLASQVIIAVPRLPYEPVAADDDVRLERVAGAVDSVGDMAGPFAGFWVVIWASSAGESSRGRDEESSGKLHRVGCAWWRSCVVGIYRIMITLSSFFSSLFTGMMNDSR